MISTKTRFGDMSGQAPDLEALAGRYEALASRAEACEDEAARREFLQEWEGTRRPVMTWTTLARVRFQQDTTDPDTRAEHERADRVATELTALDGRIKRALLEDASARAWESVVGAQAFALWRADLEAFEPQIKDELIEEQRLCSEYSSLLGSAQIEFAGEKRTLSELMRFGMSLDRAQREAAERARWSWFSEQRSRLDELYSELVQRRTRMARALGYDDFVSMGYARKRRVDYDRQDVQRFRQQVRERLVPLCSQLAERQARDLGIDSIRLWDEKVFGTEGNPEPLGGHDWMIERAQEVFGAISSRLSEFFELMRSRELLDLKSRQGKAVGGFCTYLHDFKVPFIFANFNGTRGDVRVFTHEMGHAFQRWSSSDFELSDYIGCTSESAEVHSMSLEFLTWPEMDRFFGDRADEFRRVHLLEQLMFIPYGVAVDHFQHQVYENPDATPGERFAMWRALETEYLPWRSYGDLPHAKDGGFWQWQRHIYLYPFYYIDYTLAATCALQFWERSQTDYAGAMHDYEELCKRGGSLPFRQLTVSAKLVSPFEPGCLDRVIASASRYLNL